MSQSLDLLEGSLMCDVLDAIFRWYGFYNLYVQRYINEADIFVIASFINVAWGALSFIPLLSKDHREEKCDIRSVVDPGEGPGWPPPYF